ncbi:MAG: type 1 glutamine amidotransferase [Bacteroidota bacterium]
MKVALIVCDRVKDEFVEEHGDYPAMFANLLPKLKMDSWFACDGQLPSVQDYDAYIYTGSKYSVYEDIAWIHQLTNFTKEVHTAQKKLVGICFGHQMIAHALGGKVEKSDQGYLIGVHTFRTSQHSIFERQREASLNILMLCQDQVTELPADSKVLASSGQCPVGAFMVGSNILGIQGHPEFSKAYNQAVFQSRPDKIDKEKMADGIMSFHKEVNKQSLSWLINDFLR